MKNGKWGENFEIGRGGVAFQPNTSARDGNSSSWCDGLMPSMKRSSVAQKHLSKVVNKVKESAGGEPKGITN